MEISEITRYARQLKEAFGDAALAEAAQKAKDFKLKGDSENAENWRRIEAALRQMQGPHAS